MCSTKKVWFENLQGDQKQIEVPAKWAVCSRCQGEGRHVNPSIDGNGISGEVFANDPEFAESYFSGVYDIPCEACKGRTTVLVVDPMQCDSAILDGIRRAEETKDYYRREHEAELRWGA